jgi:predicted nucleic acid-binding protein
MPATEHTFADELPAQLYLDTDILVAALVRTDAHHVRSQTLLERLVRIGTTRIFISSPSCLELADVVSRERFRDTVTEDIKQRFSLHRWQLRSIRQSYIGFFLEALEDILSFFAWDEVSLSPEV